MQLGYSLNDYIGMLEDKKMLRRELREMQFSSLEFRLERLELEIKAIEKKIKELKEIKELKDKKLNRFNCDVKEVEQIK